MVRWRPRTQSCESDMHESKSQQDTPVRTTGIIELEVPKKSVGVVVVAIVVGTLVIAVAIAVAMKVSGSNPFAGMNPDLRLLLVVAAVGTVTWLVAFPARRMRERRVQRRAKRVVADLESDGVSEAVEQFCKSFPYETEAPARSICRALAEMGRTNLTFRCDFLSPRPAIDPIDVPFEPAPLDESVAIFAGLEHDAVQDARSDLAAAASTTTRGRQKKTGLGRRVRLFGGWPVVVVVGILGLAQALGQLASGALSPAAFVLIMAAAAIAFFGVGGVGAWRHNRQFLLVPGGLVVRKPVRKAPGEWNVHVHARVSSVLLGYQKAKHSWLICVADAKVHNTALVTKAEVEMLLRAWLSPLTPPPVEQLSDLE